MGAQGTATLDFGVFPGASDAVVDTAATGVISTSLVEAWVLPVATADHTVDEHMVETIRVTGQYLSDGNIRIRGVNTNAVLPPEEPIPAAHPGRGTQINQGASRLPLERAAAPRLVGSFSVAWVWN